MSVFVSKDSRTIYISGDITPKKAMMFRRKLKFLTSQNKNDITVEINSQGGDIAAGIAIADSMRSELDVEFKTVGSGEVMSSATLILAAGDKRLVLPNTTIMLHQGSYKLSGSYSEIINGEIPDIKRSEDTYSRMLETFTNKPKKFWDEKWKNHNIYLTPKQAIKLGVIDGVIG